MSIDTLDDLLAGMRGGSFLQPVNINSQAGNGAGIDLSCWRLLNYPVLPAVPTAAAILNASSPGALPLAPRSGLQDRIIASLAVQMGVVGNTLQIEDRLAHMGGLSGILTAAQPVGIDLHSNLAVSNLAERIGPVDYSEVEWFLEWYTTTGATAVTPTAQVTFDDGSTGSVNIFNPGGGVTIPASVPSGRRYRLLPSNGRYIRAVTSVTLSATTGTAGNFGVTARRLRTIAECVVANSMRLLDWSQLRAPEIFDNSCISYAMMPLSATSGVVFGNLLQAVR